jgi:hypothetical protein
MNCPQPPNIRIFLNGQQFHERTAAAPKPSASWFPAARLVDAQRVETMLAHRATTTANTLTGVKLADAATSVIFYFFARFA